MRMRLVLAGVMVAGAVFVSRGWAAEPGVGEKATFSYKTTDGKLVTPEAVKGHIVIFDFWATWCGPCMQMAPHMVELSKTYADKGVAIIGVSLDNDAKTMADVAKKEGFSWPQICDGKGWGNAFAVAWGVQSIPHCVILAPDGTVAWSGHPAAIDAPLKELVAKYSYKAKEEVAAKPEAAAPPAPVAAAKPAGVAPAVLDFKLAAADKAKAVGKSVEAYEDYKWVAVRAPEAPQAQRAQEQVTAYEADAAFMTLYKKTLHERDGASTLWLAKSLEQAGKIEQARGYYQKIVADFADTPSAAAAKEALGRLK